MKKTLHILLFVLLSLTACVVDPSYRPVRTEIVGDIASDVTYLLCWNASFAHLAMVADKWKNAPTLEEKYDLEDEYFQYWKIREIGDTIQIVGLCKIHTFGKPLAENFWEIYPVLPSDRNCRRVFRITDEKVGVELIDNAGIQKCRLEVDTVGEEYIVAGNAQCLQLPTSSGENLKASFEITDPVRLLPTYQTQWAYWVPGGVNTAGGGVSIVVSLNDTPDVENPVVVNYLPDDRAKISYRGFKNEDSMFYWWRWKGNY